MSRPELLIESKVNSQDFTPAVVMRWGEKPSEGTQWTPHEAREFALGVLDAAAAAEHDAALVRFLVRKVDAPMEATVEVLAYVREVRGMGEL